MTTISMPITIHLSGGPTEKVVPQVITIPAQIPTSEAKEVPQPKKKVNRLRVWNLNKKPVDQKPLNSGKIEKKKENSSPTGNNLFVKNFQLELNDASLRRLFAAYGMITSCTVVKDENGRSKGHGFVCYDQPMNARNALAAMQGHVLPSGRPLYVGWAQKKEERQAVLKKVHDLIKKEEATAKEDKAPENSAKGEAKETTKTKSIKNMETELKQGGASQKQKPLVVPRFFHAPPPKTKKNTLESSPQGITNTDDDGNSQKKDLFVANLTPNVNSVILGKALGKCGSIISCNVPIGCTYGFVRFARPEGAAKAIRDFNDQVQPCGRRIQVTYNVRNDNNLKWNANKNPKEPKKESPPNVSQTMNVSSTVLSKASAPTVHQNSNVPLTVVTKTCEPDSPKSSEVHSSPSQDVDSNSITGLLRRIWPFGGNKEKKMATQDSSTAHLDDVTTLKRSLKNIQLSLQCVVCCSSTADHVFQCGHRSCEKCAKLLTECPQCRAKIISKTKTYL